MTRRAPIPNSTRSSSGRWPNSAAPLRPATARWWSSSASSPRRAGRRAGRRRRARALTSCQRLAGCPAVTANSRSRKGPGRGVMDQMVGQQPDRAPRKLGQLRQDLGQQRTGIATAAAAVPIDDVDGAVEHPERRRARGSEGRQDLEPRRRQPSHHLRIDAVPRRHQQRQSPVAMKRLEPAETPREFVEDRSRRAVRAELLLLFAGRRMVVVREAMHRDRTSRSPASAAASEAPVARRDDGQRARDRVGRCRERAAGRARPRSARRRRRRAARDRRAAAVLPAIEGSRRERLPGRASSAAPLLEDVASRAEATSKERSARNAAGAPQLPACRAARRRRAAWRRRRRRRRRRRPAPGGRSRRRDHTGHTGHVLRHDRQPGSLRLEIGEPIGLAKARPGIEGAARRAGGRSPAVPHRPATPGAAGRAAQTAATTSGRPARRRRRQVPVPACPIRPAHAPAGGSCRACRPAASSRP